MKDNYTHITFLLDRSGSMGNALNATIEGYNAFLRDQQELVGQATSTLVQFDDRYEVNYAGVPVKEAKFLTKETYQPRGWTYLYEAMGRAIVETGEFLSSMPEDQRPSKVVFTVLTDGREQHPNGELARESKFTQEQVKNLVNQQTDQYKWEFVFIGANQNAVLEGQKLGIMTSNSLTYAQNTRGTSAAFKSVSDKVKSYRAGGQSCSFDAGDRAEQEKAGVSKEFAAASKAAGNFAAKPVLAPNKNYREGSFKKD